MKIAIIGTKGIPNTYGGFEAFAENISVRLQPWEYNVTVYQPYTENNYLEPFKYVSRFGVKVFRYLPKNLQRVQYNLSSLSILQQHNPDVIICCGHSPSIFFPFFSKAFRDKLVVNMDGLEWKREKWGVVARFVLKLSERLAARYSRVMVADSMAVLRYLMSKYRKEAVFIPYGAQFGEGAENDGCTEKYNLTPMEYGLLVARIEPENRIEQAIKAFALLNKKLVVVGGVNTPYGNVLTKRYATNKNVIFAGGIYHLASLNSLRKNCRVYYHGHTAGGTNPSLLDAMAAGCTIVASDNEYNRETLADGGLYFKSNDELMAAIKAIWNFDNNERKTMAQRCDRRVKQQYTWSIVVDKYVNLINSLTNEKA